MGGSWHLQGAHGAGAVRRPDDAHGHLRDVPPRGRHHSDQPRYDASPVTGLINAHSRVAADPKGKHSSGASGIVRTYYIAADEILWDYAPYKMNKVTGGAPRATRISAPFLTH